MAASSQGFSFWVFLGLQGRSARVRDGSLVLLVRIFLPFYFQPPDRLVSSSHFTDLELFSLSLGPSLSLTCPDLSLSLSLHLFHSLSLFSFSATVLTFISGLSMSSPGIFPIFQHTLCRYGLLINLFLLSHAWGVDFQVCCIQKIFLLSIGSRT